MFMINDKEIAAERHWRTEKVQIVLLFNNNDLTLFGKNKIQMIFGSAELFSDELNKQKGTLI
jgi:hypothetical protein